jgi:2-C-methyl-D-erythritol 4-phosphate cytidylyltransferase/2-C-methyl-D-erythritol 2,4-cyclodiphosphate synthase
MTDEPAIRTGTVWAAVVAAGEGTRMRVTRETSHVRKPFLDVGGVPIVVRTLRSLSRCADIEGIALAVAPSDVEVATDLVASSGLADRVRCIVPGGARRQDTVREAVRVVPEDVEFVAVHDGARPFVSVEVLDRAVAAARRTGASCVGLPCHETIKRIDANGVITETVDRSTLFSAQTPQTFRRAQLLCLLDEADRNGTHVTDETALFDMRGIRVEAVTGERANIKITTPDDLAIAEAICCGPGGFMGGETLSGGATVGIGYDIHPLVPGRRLIVCGVELPSDVGPDGHSDADPAAHAVIDALLGAAALGDIGRLFPDTDPAYKGADSMDLLARVRGRLAEDGYSARSIDLTVFLEKPKVGPHVKAMIRRLRDVTGVPLERINVKAKTMNGIGPVGEGRAVAAQAAAVVERR